MSDRLLGRPLITSDEMAFQVTLANHPDELTTRLVYADWLEEHYRPDDAYCQRWMVAWKKWPSKRERIRPHQRIVKPYAWYIYRYSSMPEIERVYEKDREKPAWLPPLVFRALGRRRALLGETMLYNSASEAEQALVLALKRGHHEFGLKPPVEYIAQRG